jgi:hypothetical protein
MVAGCGNPDACADDSADSRRELLPAQWEGGIPKAAMYGVGFDATGHLFGHVLELQAREEELALVRTRQRNLGSLLIENWLDDVLTRRPAGEDAIDTLQSGGLQRNGLLTFGVQRQQLREAGLSDVHIDRLHRALYVYSVGFADMLKV